MSVALVHYFHTKTSSVKNISPGVYQLYLGTLNNGLIEVESVEVKSHGAETPSAVNQMPTTGQAARKKWSDFVELLKACVLEDESSEVAMSCNDVVSFLFLAKLVAIVLRFSSQLSHVPGRRLRESHALLRRAIHRTHQQLPTCGRGASGCCAQLGIQAYS